MDQLAQMGFSIHISSKTMEIDEKSSRTVLIQTEVPDDSNCIGIHQISVEVKSLQQEALEGTSYPKQFPLALTVTEQAPDDNSVPDRSDDPTLDQGPLEVEPDPDQADLPGFEAPLLISALMLVVIVIRIKKRSQ
jgi:hypothetical protein